MERSPLRKTDSPRGRKSTSASRRAEVVIVDHDSRACSAVGCILKNANDFSCSGSFSNATEALTQIPRVRPDLALVNILLPDLCGIECTKRLKLLMPQLRIVMVSGVLDPHSIKQSWRAGADNYLTKPILMRQCLATLRFTAFGPVAVREDPSGSEADSACALVPPSVSLLTPRENQVMKCFAEGRPYKEAADKLGISYSTVHNYQHRIYAKLQVTNKVEAIAKWQQSQQS